MFNYLKSLFAKRNKSISITATQKLMDMSQNELCNKFIYLRKEDHQYYSVENHIIPSIEIELIKAGNDIKLKATTINNKELAIEKRTVVDMHFLYGTISDKNNSKFIFGEDIIYLNSLQRVEGEPCGVARLLMINLYNLKEELSFSRIFLNPVATPGVDEKTKNDEELRAFYKKYLHIDESSFIQEPPLML